MTFIIPLYKLRSSYISKIYNCGKWIDGINIKRLEYALQKYLNVKYVILTNSGTSALFTAYWALKDEFSHLSIDPYTFPASYQPARILDYKIKYQRLLFKKNINLNNKRSLFTIVHLFGQPSLLTKYINKCNFIEDACQSFGAEYKGKKIGTFGRIGCLSFYPTKMLHTCGHGGAIITNNESDYFKMKLFVESGRLDGSITNSIALNLRIDEIKAEYLLNELKKIDNKIDIQRNIAYQYLNIIKDYQPFLNEENDCKHIYSTFNIMVENRNKFIKHMSKHGIETIIYYNYDVLPYNQRSAYANITSKIVAIPCRWNLIRNEVKIIKKALQSWYRYDQYS